MKTIIINASPRKNMNTAQLLKSAQKGAESVGAETEYIDIYDLQCTGCRSCLACKRKEAQRCRCFWKDDLSPILEKIMHADALIIGSPIYYGHTTSGFHALSERLLFPTLSYDDYSSYFQGKINVGIIYTMNATEEQYIQFGLKARLEGDASFFGALKGTVRVFPCYDTLQMKDYSKYSMGAYSESHKQEVHQNQFPKDLDAAFNLGAELSK